MANLVRVRVQFYGLCLCVFDKTNSRTSVMLLNAGEATPRMPYHHPLVVTETDCLVNSELATLTSFRQRIDGPVDDRIGWDAGGWHVSIGDPSAGAPTTTNTVTGPHPFDTSGPWSNMNWVASLNKIQPGCKLKTDFTAVGKHVLAVIDLWGGSLSGGTPSASIGASYVWSFSPNCQQAITDSLVFETSVPEGELIFTSGALSRKVKLAPAAGATEVPLLISHEAGNIENDDELALIKADPKKYDQLKTEPLLQHFLAFYDAIDGGPYASLSAPKGTWQYDKSVKIQYQDTPYCVFSTIEV